MQKWGLKSTATIGNYFLAHALVNIPNPEPKSMKFRQYMCCGDDRFLGVSAILKIPSWSNMPLVA